MSETILVYVGPTLDLETSKSILPEAIYLPPVKHADIVSDIFKFNPTHILIVDGCFRESIPVWHKEISYAALKGIKVYGSSSMGALRAAELADYGVMIGCGDIFWWIYEGLIEADDEVAVLYHQNPKGEYLCDTYPLVNVRAGLMKLLKAEIIDLDLAEELFLNEKSIHYTHRVVRQPYLFDQKRADAIELLTTFRELDYHTEKRPDMSFMTDLFNAMIDRERRAEYRGATITMQNLDAYISMHASEHHQILWDSKNRGLVLILADMMHIKVTEEEIEKEWTTFCARHHLNEWKDFTQWLESNLMSQANFVAMNIQNARIKKLQEAYVITTMFRRQTSTILDYLRSHDQLKMWVEDCADTERKLVDKNNFESVDIDMSVNIGKLLAEHSEATGMEITGSLEDYLMDTGVRNLEELRVCLERYRFARTH